MYHPAQGERYAYVKYYYNTGINATVREDVRLPMSMLVEFPFKKGDTVKVKPYWFSPDRELETGVVETVKDNGEMYVYIEGRLPSPYQTIFYTQALPSRKHRIGNLLKDL
jgi:hypothetical protein